MLERYSQQKNPDTLIVTNSLQDLLKGVVLELEETEAEADPETPPSVPNPIFKSSADEEAEDQSLM